MITDSRQVLAGAAQAQRFRLPAWLGAALVGLVALLPRTVALADFFTIDEPYHWVGRVARFSEALARHAWVATNQTGHPGVTTMWLGSLGQWLGAQAGITDPGWAGGGAAYLAVLRLPLAVTNALAVVIGYRLLRGLVRPEIALLAGLLWAGEPFLVAHGRLLHLDALLTSFVTLSLLLLLVWAASEGQPPYLASADVQEGAPRRCRRLLSVRRPSALVASAFFVGLALLTKAPALLLLPFAGLVIAAVVDGSEADGRRRGGRRYRVCWAGHVARAYLLWLLIALLTVVALWPAMWVAPGEAIGTVVREIFRNGGEPEPAGNFFLGQPIADPGPLFYPVVLLWRSTPWTLLGLLALPLAFSVRSKDEAQRANAARLWSSDVAPQDGWLTASTVRRPLSEGRTLCILGAFVLFWISVMSLEPKKFDRYLLPVWPSLEVLAAAGLVGCWQIARRTLRRWPRAVAWSGPAAMLALLAAIGGTLWRYHSYEIGYYNPLLGGGATAQRVMLVGWGEGMEQVGAWLRTRPDLSRGPVLSWIPPTLAPFVPASTLVLDLRPELTRRPSSYAVLYARSVQRQESAAAEAYVRQTPPLYPVQRHGIIYATVHQLPRPFATPRDARFDGGVHLRGFTQAHIGTTLVVTPSWDIQRDQPGGAFVFVHLLAANGQRVAQIDAPLDRGMFAQWQAGQQFDPPLPLALPPDLPQGTYRLALGVYDPATGARRAIDAGPALPTEVDGSDALDLGAVRLE